MFRSLVLVLCSLIGGGGAWAAHWPWDQAHDRFNTGDDGRPQDCEDGSPNQCGSPVEVQSGNFIHGLGLIHVSSIGPELGLSLTYHSHDQRAGAFGNGWTHSFDQRLLQTTDEVNEFVINTRPDGRRERFTKQDDGSYLPPPHIHASLIASRGGGSPLILREKSGLERHYNADGYLSAIVDPNGNRLEVAYDPTGFLTDVTDATGRQITFTKGAEGRVSEVHDPAGNVWALTYDGEGNLTEIIDPLGHVQSFTYSDRLMTRITDDAGTDQMRISYDGQFRVSSYTMRQQVWTYNYQSGRTVKTNQFGHSWTYDYTATGNITTVTDPIGGVFSRVYDDHLNVTSTTDENGNTSTFTYDERGNRLTATDALGNATTLTYEPQFNRLASVTNPLGGITQFDYDDRGNLISTTDPFGAVATMDVDGRGLVTKVTDALGNISTLSYDEHGNLIGTVDALGITASSTFDVLGRVKSSTDGLGRVTSYTYDDVGKLTQMTDAAGGVTGYTYDDLDRLTTVTDPEGKATSYGYDQFNRRITEATPLGAVFATTWDARDNMATRSNPDGQVTTYTHDGLNRLTDAVAPDSHTSFIYDAGSRITRITDDDSGLTYTYDAADRLETVSTDASAVQPETTISYAYDAAGNRTGLTHPGGETTVYARDIAGRVTSITAADGDVFTPGYDVLSRPETLTYPNGITLTSVFDEVGRLASLSYTGGSQPMPFGYQFNDAHSIIQITDIDGVHDYGYDDLDRLTSADHPAGQDDESYSYDGVGNRLTSHLSSGYNYGDDHRLESDDVFDYGFNNSGSRISKTNRTTGEVTTYHYSAEQQLVQVDLPSGAVAEYFYDGLGRRIAKRVDGELTSFIYDGEAVLQEIGAETRDYIPGLRSMSDADVAYIHADHLSTPRFTTDEDGDITWRWRSDSFGIGAADEDPDGDGSSVELGNRFPGQWYDTETGLHYNRFRDYEPSTGRYLQRDPIGLAGGLNTYAYVGGNPIIFIDILGLDRLGIHSNFSSPSLSTRGHAWLTYTDSNGVTVSLGLWPDSHPMTQDNGSGSDVRVGLEDNEIPVASRYYELSEAQVRELKAYVEEMAEWKETNNCSSWASEGVRRVVGEDVNADDWWLLGAETPRKLSQSIRNLENDSPTSQSNPLPPSGGGGGSSW